MRKKEKVDKEKSKQNEREKPSLRLVIDTAPPKICVESIFLILHYNDTTKKLLAYNFYIVSFPIHVRWGNNHKSKSNFEVVIICEATKQPGIIFTNIIPSHTRSIFKMSCFFSTVSLYISG